MYWLQEYVYKFNYDNDGGVTVDLTTNGKPVEKSNKKKPVSMLSVPKACATSTYWLCIDAVLPVHGLSDDGLWCVIEDIVSVPDGDLWLQKANVSSVKYQVCRLIRMLVHICKTLDSMPEEVRRLSSLLIFPLRHLSLHLANLQSTAAPCR